MFYERKIKYFDYIENGEKIKNVGFIKIEVRDEECNIDIQIKGVPLKDSIKREIILNGYDKTSLLGELTLQNGEGSIQLHKCNSMALGSMNLVYTELENIQITVDGNRIIRCLWMPRSASPNMQEKNIADGKPQLEEGQYVKQNSLMEDEQEESELETKEKFTEEIKPRMQGIFHFIDKMKTEDKTKAGDTLKVEDKMKVGDILKSKDEINVGDKNKTEDERKVENMLRAEDKNKEKNRPHTKNQEEITENTNFREDKWSQLANIYPRICPFEDEREYLMIQPRDFVILGSKSYSLVNNSFLLHGYYNYNHLILVKKMSRGEDTYYIGVPGNFYDREKQVAIMFGFESFECKEESAGLGDYGYYMIRVEL